MIEKKEKTFMELTIKTFPLFLMELKDANELIVRQNKFFEFYTLFNFLNQKTYDNLDSVINLFTDIDVYVITLEYTWYGYSNELLRLKEYISINEDNINFQVFLQLMEIVFKNLR